jgi:hypothetical protein
MKKYLFIAVIILIVGTIGCALYPPPPAGEGVCDKAPKAVLCQAFAYTQITPEQANDFLLDASAISVWRKWMDKEKLLAALDKVEKFFNDNPSISLDTLIKYAVKESNVDPAMASLLSRRLARLQNIPQISQMVLDPDSRQMIVGHFENQREQLTWF